MLIPQLRNQKLEEEMKLHVAIITQQQNELKQWRGLKTSIEEIRTIVQKKSFIETWTQEKTTIQKNVNQLKQQIQILERKNIFLDSQDKLQKKSNFELERMITVKQEQLNKVRAKIGTQESIDRLMKVVHDKQSEINRLRLSTPEKDAFIERETQFKTRVMHLQNENLKIKSELQNVNLVQSRKSGSSSVMVQELRTENQMMKNEIYRINKDWEIKCEGLSQEVQELGQLFNTILGPQSNYKNKYIEHKELVGIWKEKLRKYEDLQGLYESKLVQDESKTIKIHRLELKVFVLVSLLKSRESKKGKLV